MNDLLDWVEKAAIESLRSHHTAADTLAKDAATTLTLLLAGMAGALAYVAKGVDSALPWLAWGSAVFAGYLLLVSIYLVVRCLVIDDIPAIYNEPKNLLGAKLEFEALRRAELDNFQERIDDTANRNRITAKALNHARLAAILSPIVFGVTAWLAAC